jgi:hypothetical protein
VLPDPGLEGIEEREILGSARNIDADGGRGRGGAGCDACGWCAGWCYGL